MRYLLALLTLSTISAKADYIHGYQRRDGGYVQGYERTHEDNTIYNNYGYQRPQAYEASEASNRLIRQRNDQTWGNTNSGF